MDIQTQPITSARKPIDLHDVIERTANGETYREIAKAYSVDPMTIYRAIERADETLQSAHARARAISAEAWLDRGLEAIEAAARKDSEYDVGAARAYAQECARRAAIRNHAYRDAPTVAVTVDARKSAAHMTDDELARIIETQDVVGNEQKMPDNAGLDTR